MRFLFLKCFNLLVDCLLNSSCSKPKSEHNSDGPELRGVLTERNLDPPARSFPRRRLICDDDELEVARTVSNGTTSHGSSGTSTVKHPNGARQSSRSKVRKDALFLKESHAIPYLHDQFRIGFDSNHTFVLDFCN